MVAVCGDGPAGNALAREAVFRGAVRRAVWRVVIAGASRSVVRGARREARGVMLRGDFSGDRGNAGRSRDLSRETENSPPPLCSSRVIGRLRKVRSRELSAKAEYALPSATETTRIWSASGTESSRLRRRTLYPICRSQEASQDRTLVGIGIQRTVGARSVAASTGAAFYTRSGGGSGILVDLRVSPHSLPSCGGWERAGKYAERRRCLVSTLLMRTIRTGRCPFVRSGGCSAGPRAVGGAGGREVRYNYLVNLYIL